METTTAKRKPYKPTTVPKTALPEPQLGDNHPLNDIIGSMGGEGWEEMLKNIKRNRKELDRLVLGDEVAE